MTKLYKLTDANGVTRSGEANECQWGVGITHTGTGKGDLCGPGYIHAYTHPILAVLLNPTHAHYEHPRLWEAEGEVSKTDHGLKVGCVSLTTVREIDVPTVTTEMRLRFAILCTLRVYTESAFTTWANNWLRGKNRSKSAADAMAQAAYVAAYVAADAAQQVDMDLAEIAEEAIETNQEIRP